MILELPIRRQARLNPFEIRGGLKRKDDDKIIFTNNVLIPLKSGVA